MQFSLKKPQKKSLQLLCILGLWSAGALAGYLIWLWPSQIREAQLHQAQRLQIQTLTTLQKSVKEIDKTRQRLTLEAQRLESMGTLQVPDHPEAFLNSLIQTSNLTWVSLKPIPTDPLTFELITTGSFSSILLWMRQMGDAPVFSRLNEWSLVLNAHNTSMHPNTDPTLTLNARMTLAPPSDASSSALSASNTRVPLTWPRLDETLGHIPSPFEQPSEKTKPHGIDPEREGEGDAPIFFFHPQHTDPQVLDTILKQAISAHVLDPGVHIAIDARTHTLMVRAPSADLKTLKKLLQETDKSVPEIQIEARIVAVDSRGLKELGVIWQSQGTHPIGSVGSGNLTLTQLSAQTGIAHPTSQLGLSMAHLPSGFQLDMALQALQSDGHGTVISAPQILVYSQQEAYIEQGKEVPFQTISQEGTVQVQFKKAVLGLWVTPTLTPSGKLLLKIKVNNDSISQELGHAGEIPVIDTTQMKTEVFANNHQTLVLGGINTSMETHFTHKVPLLGDIPGLGALFRSTRDQRQTAELLIFITPSIVVPSVTS